MSVMERVQKQETERMDRMREFSEQKEEQPTERWSVNVNALPRLKSTVYELQAECGGAKSCDISVTTWRLCVCLSLHITISISIIHLAFLPSCSFGLLFFSFTNMFFSYSSVGVWPTILGRFIIPQNTSPLLCVCFWDAMLRLQRLKTLLYSHRCN